MEKTTTTSVRRLISLLTRSSVSDAVCAASCVALADLVDEALTVPARVHSRDLPMALDKQAVHAKYPVVRRRNRLLTLKRAGSLEQALSIPCTYAPFCSEHVLKTTS